MLLLLIYTEWLCELRLLLLRSFPEPAGLQSAICTQSVVRGWHGLVRLVVHPS